MEIPRERRFTYSMNSRGSLAFEMKLKFQGMGALTIVHFCWVGEAELRAIRGHSTCSGYTDETVLDPSIMATEILHNKIPVLKILPCSCFTFSLKSIIGPFRKESGTCLGQTLVST